MADQINDFDARTSEDVIRLLRKQQRQIDNLTKIIQEQHQPQVAESLFLARVTETADAATTEGRSGKGKAEYCGLDRLGNFVKKTSATPFYNFTKSPNTVGARGVLVRDPYSGKLAGVFPGGYWERRVDYSGGGIASGGTYGTLTADSISMGGSDKGNSTVPGGEIYIEDDKLYVLSEGYRRVGANIFVDPSGGTPGDVLHFELGATNLSNAESGEHMRTFKTLIEATPTTFFAEWIVGMEKGDQLYFHARNHAFLGSIGVRAAVSSAM